MKTNNRMDVIVPDKYLKSETFNPMDELFIGAVKCLREQGKFCEFLGFNILNGHVAVIDGIKYYTKGYNAPNIPATLSYANFWVVSDVEHDWIEDRFKERVTQILDVLDRMAV